MFDPFSQLFQHFWGHARALHMVLELHSLVSVYYRSNSLNLSILWRSEKVQQLVFPLDFLSIISKSNLSNGNPSHNALQVCCGICLPLFRAGKAITGLSSSSSPGQVDLLATVSDSLSLKRCFFPSRAPLVPLKVVCRSSVTKSCTPTFRGQGDTKVSQQFQFDWDCRQVTFKAYLPDRQEAGQVIL